ncbi:hypothetical protein FA15DRAFT_668137, partial [Coprinopsis marcescibilis]
MTYSNATTELVRRLTLHLISSIALCLTGFSYHCRTVDSIIYPGDDDEDGGTVEI